MSPEQIEMVLECIPIADKITGKIARGHNDIDDVKAQAYLILIELVIGWSPEKYSIPFKVYVVNNLRSKLSKYAKSRRGLIYYPTKRRNSIPEPEYVFLGLGCGEIEEYLWDMSKDTEAAVIQREQLQQMYEAIERLPERTKTVIKYILEQDNNSRFDSEKELAKITGLTRSSINKIYNTAVKQLRRDIAYAV